MKTLLNTLYVTSPDAYLRLDGDTICVELDREKVLQVPLHHIGSVVCFGDAMLTPPLMQRCTADGKSIAFLDRHGGFAARVEGAVSGNVLLRLDQFAAFSSKEFQLTTSRNIVAGKVHNSRQVLMRGAREAADESDKNGLSAAAEFLAAMLRKLESATNLDEIRGIEGECARTYFGTLSHVIRIDRRAHFKMNGRSRRPPLDRFNALLSFLYTLLMIDCRAALEAVGLDPQIGFLHALRPGRPALALDLMEEFRPVLADRVALTVVNRGQVSAGQFEVRPGGGVLMSPEARKELITTYQKRKQEEIAHGLVDDRVALGIVPHLQARLMARTIRGDMDAYLPFVYR